MASTVSEMIKFLQEVQNVFGDIKTDYIPSTFDFNVNFGTINGLDISLFWVLAGEAFIDSGVSAKDEYVDTWLKENKPEYYKIFEENEDDFTEKFEFIENANQYITFSEDEDTDEELHTAFIAEFLNSNPILQKRFWNAYIKVSAGNLNVDLQNGTLEKEYDTREKTALLRIAELKKNLK